MPNAAHLSPAVPHIYVISLSTDYCAKFHMCSYSGSVVFSEQHNANLQCSASCNNMMEQFMCSKTSRASEPWWQ